jgi:hypothetical protein
MDAAINAVIRKIQTLSRDMALDESSGLTIKAASFPSQLPEPPRILLDSIQAALELKLPPDVKYFWETLGGARLFEDIKYGQWGLVLTPPWQILEQHQYRVATRDTNDVRKGDLVFGDFLGDADKLVIRCDDNESDYGAIIVSTPIDHRDKWFVVGATLGDFLSRYIECKGEMFWWDEARKNRSRE